MPKVPVVYDSRSGNTEKIAMVVADGARAAKVDVEAKKAVEVALQDLEGADGIVFGSPTHFGTMSENMKKLIGDSVQIRKKMENKVGNAFTFSANEQELFASRGYNTVGSAGRLRYARGDW